MINKCSQVYERYKPCFPKHRQLPVSAYFIIASFFTLNRMNIEQMGNAKVIPRYFR